MKGSNSTQPQVLSTRLSSLTMCVRLALGIAVTSTAFISPAFAEGTKQWAPSSSDYSALAISEAGSATSYPFAGYDMPAERRINIHIANPSTEVVYIGLSKLLDGAGYDATFSYYFRIKDPNGNVVFGPYQVTSATANITSHAQAVAGPATIAAGGYTSAGNYYFVPSGGVAGDYYIEFDLNNSTASVGTTPATANYPATYDMYLKWFDITVADQAGAAGHAIDGRVWSKSWATRVNNPATYPTNAFGTPFNGSMYAYDSNNFVTKIDFQNSGLRPLQGQFSFNNTGPGSSGNKEADRKSVDTANQTNPQHKIFLNPPDTAVYPLGVDGSLQNLPLSISSINNSNIKVEATQPGAVEIVLDIDKNGSYTAGIDRRLIANVTAGVNYITWDGKNGAGSKVLKSSFPIDVLISYTQGETHFTAYDVEGLDNGFNVFTQTSGGLTGPNLLFWDDSNIADATSNTPDRGQVNVDTGNTLRRTWSNNSYGDLNTINTWWFAYRDYQSTVINLAPSVELSVATASDAEASGGNLPVLVVSGNLLTAATVEVALSGTAVGGTDYAPASSPITITIPAGNYADTQIPIPGLSIMDDSVVEGDDTLILTLQNPVNIAIDDANANNTTISQSTYTIVNDDFNTPPVATDDSGVTDEDTPLNGSNLLGNDTDVDGDTLTINTTPVTPPTNGTLVINANGTYTYTPKSDFNGTDSFEYEIDDGKGGKDTATVTITVNPVNDPPVATDDNGVTDEDTPLNGANLLGNDSDVDGDQLTINTAPVTPPSNGTLVIKPDGTYTYTPNPDFNGTDSFEYEVSDGNGKTDTATVTITINPVNDNPVAVNDSATTAEDVVLHGSTVLVNDSDVDGDTPLTVTTTPVTPPAHGTLALNSDGTYTYTPAKDYNGSDSFVYEVKDGKGGTATATVDITITPVDDPPVITSTNNVTFAENGTGTALDVQSTDPDGDKEGAGLTYNLQPLFDGSLFTIDPVTGEITFNTPPDYENPQDANHDNAYILMTEVCDSTSRCTQQVEVIVVTNVVETSPPTIISTIAQMPENQTFVTDIQATDPDPDTLTYSITGGADAALFTIDPNTGELSFLGAPNYENPGDADHNNKYELVVTVTDNTAPDHTDSQSLQVVVTNVNEAPAITSDGGGSSANLDHAENSTLVTTVAAVDPDVGDTIVYSINGGADANLFTINPTTGELSFKTAPDFENPGSSDGDNIYVVQVMADDANSLFDLQTLNITVQDINDAPVLTSDGGGASATLHVTENSTAVTTATSTDQDGDTPVYSLSGGVDAGLFQIDPVTGALSFKLAPDYEHPQDTGADNTYDVQISVADGQGGTDVQALSVVVDNLNEAPTITSDGGGDVAAPAPVVAENTTVVTTVVGADPDAGDTQTYSITGGVDAALFSIDPSTGVLSFVAAPDYEHPTDVAGGASGAGDNVYEVEVTVTDDGSLTDVQTLLVEVGNANEAPVITSDGGLDTASINAPENQTAVTTVTATDPDVGDTPSFSLSGGADAGLFQIDPVTGVLSFKTAPDFENPADTDHNNDYIVEVTVDDGQGGVDIQTLTISVTDVNDVPTITSNGGGDTAGVSLNENTTAVTTVTSTDQDGGAPSYSLSGGADKDLFEIDPATGVLSFVAAPDFENPADADHNNDYVVEVTVDDGQGGVDIQTLTISVQNVNDPPVITSDGGGDTAALSVAENQVVTTDVNATDDDGDTLTYSLSGGVDVGLFAINNITGALVFKTTPDFEHPLDGAGGSSAAGDNIYEVQVTAADGKGGTDVQMLSITVTDVNEAPVITSDGGKTTTTLHVNEEQAAATTVTATDPDTGDKLTYAITGGPDDHLFSIDPATGALTFNAVPDYEHPADADHNNQYVVEVTVDDGQGGYDVQTLTIVVDNVNDPPVITSDGGGDAATLAVAENTTAVTTATSTDQDGDVPAYSISGGADAALFEIDPVSGALVFKAAPDFENPADANHDNVYAVEITVADGHGGTDAQGLDISVTDANEAPVITSDAGGDTASLSLDENNPQVTTVAASDPDPADTLTYAISGGVDKDLFEINPTTGELTFKAAPDFENPQDAAGGTSAEGDNVYEVEVMVADGHGNTDTQMLGITVADTNEAPVITSNGGGDSAALDAAENQTAVTTVVGADPDAGDTLAYSLSGGVDAGLFEIDPATGVLSFKTAPDFESPADADHNGVYDVEVTVTDQGNLSDVQTLAISVTDVNELPVITSDGGGDAAALDIAENTTAVTTVASTDDDGDTPTYSLGGGVDKDLFEIDPATGVLSFKVAPDYEHPADAEGGATGAGDNVYEVQVTADDGKGGVDTQTLAIRVLNANDPPVITSDGGGDTAALSVKENQVVTTTITSRDDDGDTPAYSISGGVDADLFAINNVTGVLVFKDDPDYEHPLDKAGGVSAAGDNIYEVEVKVADGKGGVDTQLLSITVEDMNEAPVISSDGGNTTASLHVPEQQSAVTTVAAADQDAGNTLAYSITGGVDDHLFTIDPTTGALSFKTAPDYENPADADHNNQYVVEVTVDDGKGGYDVQTLTVIVDNVNDAPVITSDGGGPLATLTLEENAAGGAVTGVTADDQDGDTLTYSINGGEDAGLFEIDPATGVLRFKTAPDFENPQDVGKDNTYNVGVLVDDGHGGLDAQVLNITLDNTNEAPVITSDGGGDSASLNVMEGQTAVTTATAIDADGDTPSYSLSGGADAGLFEIDPATGVLTFKAAPDHEAPQDANGDNVYNVEITVADGHGGTDVQSLDITVKDDGLLRLSVRALLQGAYQNSAGLMADTLHLKGLLPLAQPYNNANFSYNGNEVLGANVLALPGNDAPVDWMLVEVRAAADPKQVVYRHALVAQRDGDLVDGQSGETSFSFNGAAGEYYVAVRHRNHLGVMTAAPLKLSDQGTLVDFSLVGTPVQGSHARLEMGATALLWAGDANLSDSLIANGPGTDVNTVLGTVLQHPGNLLVNSNYRLNGYYDTDLNLDGVTLYSGPDNDINLLLGNVLLHPGNGLFAANFIVNGSLPK